MDLFAMTSVRKLRRLWEVDGRAGLGDGMCKEGRYDCFGTKERKEFARVWVVTSPTCS